MTYEDLLVAIDAAAPNMNSCALRLLLRLISIAIQHGTNQVKASDRLITEQLGFSKAGVTAAKRGVAPFVGVVATKGTVTTFDLPATWFTPQRSLFSTETALVSRAHRPDTQGPSALVNGALAPFLAGQSALVNGAECPDEQGGRPDGQGGVPFLAGRGALVNGAPTTGNQQDTDAPSRSKSISGVSNTVKERIFSILSIRSVPPELRPQAAVLAPELQHSLFTAGNVEVAKNLPDDVVLGQCLAIADLREILPAIKLAKARKGRPRGYPWFVTVLMESVLGISREDFAAVREEWRRMRTAKPPASERGGSFQSNLVAQAAGQVKRLH